MASPDIAVAALALACAARSDVGGRRNNEDACFASSRIAALADGVGGAAGGEVASATAINAMVALDKRRLEDPLEAALAEAVLWANEAIGFVAACRPELAGMSTTLTAVGLSDHGDHVVAHVGDSRAYLHRDGELVRLTRDESFVQELIDTGAITPEEAREHPQRSLVMRALDGGPDRRPGLTTLPARGGDRLLLCSDGLTDVVDDQAIAGVLSGPDRAACADRLVALALEAGARDNVSVIVADVIRRADPGTGWRGP